MTASSGSRHLRYVPLPGGDTTIRKPYRAALAHLWAAGIDWAFDLAPVRTAPEAERTVLSRQLERDVHCVPTSSMGRLFDAVSSLIGIRHVVSYEAQAAIEMETTAVEHVDAARDYRFSSVTRERSTPRPVLRAIVADLRNGCARGAIAAGFHLAVAGLVAESADRSRGDRARPVALSGGVFQNVLLVRLTRAELAGRGFQVLTHRLVPPNDGGLALGQAAVAARRLDAVRGDMTDHAVAARADDLAAQPCRWPGASPAAPRCGVRRRRGRLTVATSRSSSCTR